MRATFPFFYICAGFCRKRAYELNLQVYLTELNQNCKILARNCNGRGNNLLHRCYKTNVETL